MAGHKFNLFGLNSIYVDALKADRKTIVFEVKNGRGILVFMMFFSDEDESKDLLFVYLANTNQMLSFKMYGRHKEYDPEKNDFYVFVTAVDEEKIKQELGINGGTVGFSLADFLSDVNAAIPPSLPTADLQAACQSHLAAFAHHDLRKVVDKANQIYLVGPRGLPAGKRPQEKTLRKLYLHVQAAPEVLDQFIRMLKQSNTTVAWSDDPAKASRIGLRSMLGNI